MRKRLQTTVVAACLALAVPWGSAIGASYTVTSGLFEVQGELGSFARGMGFVNGPATYPEFPYIIASPFDQRPLITEQYSFSIDNYAASSYCIDNAPANSPCARSNGRTLIPILWTLTESNRLLSVVTTPNVSGTISLPFGFTLVAVPGPVAGAGIPALIAAFGGLFWAIRRRPSAA